VCQCVSKVERLESVDGVITAEVDAGTGYIRIRADTSGGQAIALLRCKRSDRYVFILYDASRFDKAYLNWDGWEVVYSSLKGEDA